MTGNCLQFRLKFEKQLLAGAKLQFRKCFLFPKGEASKRPRGLPEGKYNCCMIRPRQNQQKAKAMAVSQVPCRNLNLYQV